ncbi:MAG: hypothetical protein IJW64_03485, partial [Clostridia bacterium]|nr:hypothetical protein [Clostridia bacterium]
MKKFIIGILSTLFLFSCVGLIACQPRDEDSSNPSESSTSSSGSSAIEQGSYVIKYYFENEDGQFVYDESKDETGTMAVGETISVTTPTTFDGYVFDEENLGNKLSSVITLETGACLELYYKLEITTEIMFKAVNTNYVQAVNQVTATINVLDGTLKQGVVTLYNTEATINALNAKESYYLFATEGEKASLSVYNGSELVEIKNADITAVSAGNHTYKIAVNEDKSIVCALDGNQVLTVSESEITDKGLTALTTAGRAGSYTSGGRSLVNLTVDLGDMSASEIKAHFKETLLKTPASYYTFGTANYPSLNRYFGIHKKVEDVSYDAIYGFS